MDRERSRRCCLESCAPPPPGIAPPNPDSPRPRLESPFSVARSWLHRSPSATQDHLICMSPSTWTETIPAWQDQNNGPIFQ